MKRKSLAFIILLISFLLFGFNYKKCIDLLNFSVLNKSLMFVNNSSLSNRILNIAMPLALDRDCIKKYREHNKAKIKNEEFKTIELSKQKGNIKIKNIKKVYEFTSNDILDYSQLFIINGDVCMIKRDYNNEKFKRTKNKIIFLEKKHKVSYTDIDYINPSYNLLGMKFKNKNTVFTLNNKFEIIKTIKLKGNNLIKDIFKKRNKIFIHRKRYIQGEHSVEVLNGNKIYRYFYIHQSKNNNIEKIAVMDDTVFCLGENRFYITFTYPKHKIIIYAYGQYENEKYIINFDDNYYMNDDWVNYNKLKRKGVDEIVSVNNIIEVGDYTYIFISKNSIKNKENIYMGDYMVAINIKKRVLYNKINLKYGTPVYYDKIKQNFYSLKNRSDFSELYKWQLSIN